MSKVDDNVVVLPEDGESGQADVVLDEKSGTSSDVIHMRRMGKKQLFRRNFGFITIFGFAMVLTQTWQTLLSTVVFALGNGGTSGLIYMYIVVAIFFFFVNMSMAEMASMAPTAGGQYHWISEFAPKSKQKFLSYMIGWLCVLGWQTGVAIGSFLAGTEIQGLIVLNNPNYVYERWQGTLLMIAIVFFIAIFNTFLAKHLPLVEGVILCLYFAGFIGILVPLWALGPRSTSASVWNAFQDGGGWGSTGLATLVGLITPVSANLGADAAVHMSEELKNASKTLPRIMFWTTAANGVLGFAMMVTFCYTLGDLESVITTPTGYPFIQVFYNATQSKGAATAMSMILVVSSTASAMTNMATASRQLFAFARDHGVPFSQWFATVPAGWDIPLNSIIFTICFSTLFALVNIGSTVAFYQVVSLGLSALLASYLLSISCVLLRRLRHQPVPESDFKLGKWGATVNTAAICFLSVAWVMSFFPVAANPTPQSMNWSCMVFGVVVIAAGVYYFVKARFVYVGPVEYVQKRE